MVYRLPQRSIIIPVNSYQSQVDQGESIAVRSAPLLLPFLSGAIRFRAAGIAEKPPEVLVKGPQEESALSERARAPPLSKLHGSSDGPQPARLNGWHLVSTTPSFSGVPYIYLYTRHRCLANISMPSRATRTVRGWSQNADVPPQLYLSWNGLGDRHCQHVRKPREKNGEEKTMKVRIYIYIYIERESKNEHVVYIFTWHNSLRP